MSTYYLKHHGILGQKWGKRNGPPYPLDKSQYSSEEKQRQLVKSKKQREGLTDQQKKWIKIGAIAVGVALATAGGVYLVKSGKADDLILSGKSLLQNKYLDLKIKALSGAESYIDSLSEKTVNALDKLAFLGRSKYDDFGNDIANINYLNLYKNGIQPTGNCAHCSVSYILNSMFGKQTVAKQNYYVDEVSGMLINGRDPGIVDSIFKGIKHIDKNGIIDVNNKPVIPELFFDDISKEWVSLRELKIRGLDEAKAMSKIDLDSITFNHKNKISAVKTLRDKIPNNTKGCLTVFTKGEEGHILNYYRDNDIFKLIDTSGSWVFDVNSIKDRGKINKMYPWIWEIMDFSNASLSGDAGNILKYLVDGF